MYYIDIKNMIYPIHSGDIKLSYPEWTEGDDLPDHIKVLDVTRTPPLTDTQTFFLSGVEELDGNWFGVFTVSEIGQEILDMQMPKARNL